MASAVKPVAQSFSKVHDVFNLACSDPEKEDRDALFSAPNNTCNNKAFSSFKKPAEGSAVPDIDVDADRTKAFSVGPNSESINGCEPLQDDGPSTPMRYLARPKHIHAETPDSADSLPPLSLAMVSHSVDKELIKQESAEPNNVCSPAVSLAMPKKEPQTIPKPDPSSVLGLLDAPGASELSMTTGFETKQPKSIQHMSVLTHPHIPQSCNSVTSVSTLQSSETTPGRINQTKCSIFDMNTKQHIKFNNGQQGAETTKYPQVIPMSVNGMSFNFRQGFQHEDIFQGSASRQKFRNSACMTNPFCYSTTNVNQLEAPNYMPLLQTPLMAAGLGGQRLLNNEDNLILSNKNGQPSAKKRKLDSQKHPLVYPVAESTPQLNQSGLEARQRSENTENEHLEGGQRQRKQVKRFRSPNNKVENFKSMNGLADLHIMNNVGKLKQLPESMAMKSNETGAVNSSPNCGSYSLGSTGHGSPSETGKSQLTLSLEAGKADILSNHLRTGNTEPQSSDDNKSHPLGLRLLTFPAYAPLPTAVSTFSSGGPSLPQYIMNQGNAVDSSLVKRETSKRTSPELEWGKFLALSATPDTSLEVEGTKNETLLPYQKSFMRLQAFLKQCDEPNPEYLKTLQALSAAARSGHAVELESRAIMLSLEEVKEINRMKALNVFAKSFSNGANGEITTVSTKAPKLVSNP